MPRCTRWEVRHHCPQHIVSPAALSLSLSPPLSPLPSPLSLAASASSYAIETDITRRVSEWQDRLQPVLDEQHARHEFNIENYNSGILSSLVSGTESDAKVAQRKGVPSALEGLSFENVLSSAVTANPEGAAAGAAAEADGAGGVAPYEVCRLFLSTLFLTKQGNVDLQVADCDVEGTAESFKLILLNEQQMDVSQFRAPSLAAQ